MRVDNEGKLFCDADAPSLLSHFEVSAQDGKIALKSYVLNKYICAEVFNKSYELTCTRDKCQGWELFTCSFAPSQELHFFNLYKQRFMSSSLSCTIFCDNSKGHDTWSSFLIEPHCSSGRMHMKTCTNLYVCAEKNPLLLIADRKAAKEWECFSIELHEDCSFAFYSHHKTYIGSKFNANDVAVDRKSVAATETFAIYY